MINNLSIQAKEEQDLHIAKHIEPKALPAIIQPVMALAQTDAEKDMLLLSLLTAAYKNTCTATDKSLYTTCRISLYDIELFWNWALEADGFFGHRVNEGEDFGMETESVDGRILVSMAILAVADHRTAFGGEVDTDLVRAAGFEV